MSNTYGRQVVVPLTNKSGGGVIAGDVVIPDTSNDGAFTTTTSAAYTGLVWIAQDTIASNATGRVLTEGYAALVNVNASVTRGHYGATHTVAKQAADVGAARTTGSFCRFLTGGTTPTAVVYPADYLASNAFSGCRSTNSGSQTIGTSVTAVTFDTDVYDTDAYHNTGANTSRFTVPTTAYYRIAWSAFWNQAPTAPTLWTVVVNGATYQPYRRINTTAITWMAYECTLSLTAGDYVEAACQQANASARELGVAVYETTFEIQRVGL